MKGVSEVFRNRKIPFTVEVKDSLPILTAHACPYPELAEKDRSICAMERMLFSDLVGEKLSLESCRLDGDSCCSFQPSRLEQLQPKRENALSVSDPGS